MKFVIICTAIAIIVGFFWGMSLGYMAPVIVPLIAGVSTAVGSFIIFAIYDHFTTKE